MADPGSTGSTLGRVGSLLWRGLKFTGRVAVEGLTHIGFAYTVMPPGYFAAIRAGKQARMGAAEWDDTADSAPPGPVVYHRHPERLVADEPLTEAEEGLWAQLMGPGRITRRAPRNEPPVDRLVEPPVEPPITEERHAD